MQQPHQGSSNPSSDQIRPATSLPLAATVRAEGRRGSWLDAGKSERVAERENLTKNLLCVTLSGSLPREENPAPSRRPALSRSRGTLCRAPESAPIHRPCRENEPAVLQAFWYSR